MEEKIELNDRGSVAVMNEKGVKKEEDIEEREQWGRKLDFMLSCIGYAVGLGNVWRFPYLAYENGGGAFLLPYILFLFLCGMPLFFMELSVGQYLQLGPISCWKAICPAFSGIGYAMLVVSLLVGIYYNVIIAWCLYYLFESFRSDVPWRHCNNKWNTPRCVEGAYKTHPTNGVLNMTGNITCDINYQAQYLANGSFASCKYLYESATRVSPSSEYWERYVLELTDDIGNTGGIKWELALTLLAAWVIVYFCMWKGVKSSGKVVYFTATFPYVVLFALFIRGVTLEGAGDGIKFYLNPDFEKLKDPEVWVKAATQIFYSLGVGFGSLVAMGSYNKFNNNCLRDAVTVSLINCGTSVFAGFVIFSVIGAMSHQLQVPIEKVASSGPGLAFVAYPEGIAQMPVSPLWAILFFLMLLTLGLDSEFAMIECVVTGISDEYPRLLRKYKEIFILITSIVCYLIGLSNVTRAGAYVLNLFDWQSGGVSLLFLALFESICIGWFYGSERLRHNVFTMTNKKPGLWWSLCWKYFCPIIIGSIFVFSLVKWQGVSYNTTYKYPAWAEILGWFLAVASMICIPLGFIAALLGGKGPLQERLFKICKPNEVVMREIEVRENLPQDLPCLV
ncbi:sodium- and chloride-dependent GABA transporter 1-like [Rhopilema esculentum]|uniref:sodium- and chloride-dependent GABA transporter 1-like n=1 Tax=Rhopilema esculentum TaxID=499914 RepID=UPI0031DC6DC7